MIAMLWRWRKAQHWSVWGHNLTQLSYSFQQSDIFEGIDVVWTEQKALGVAGHWLRDKLVGLPQDVWRGE